ncbi:MAG: diguanylate cyclase [Candidatus Omnitrophica bacterium]|nr:diguanylate cyclase [Candidatus Omnitrophota bacterium]
MLKSKTMEKLLYCNDGLKKRKDRFPFSYVSASSIQKARDPQYPLVVFDYKFIKRRKNADLSFIKDKICFLCFDNQKETKLSEIKKLGFFGYFLKTDSKALVSFKIKRARNFLKLEEEKIKLTNKVADGKDNLENVALIDSLTGCHNWRYFLEETKRQLIRSKRHSEKVSFIGIDIDHFRQINEIYGIKIADRVIKDIVKLLEKRLRKEDILSRWREDEFFIIAPYLNKANLPATAHRLKEAISRYKFKYGNISLRIKASVGAISFPEDSIFNPKDVTVALDRTIAQAKRKGGNSVVVSSRHQVKPTIKKENKATIEEMQEKVERLSILLNKDILDVIYGFARAIEAKDAYTGSHVEYTAAIAKRIASELKLPKNEIEDIEHAAVLHDLGKVGIDGAILSKKGVLTSKERKIIQTHPSIASEILKDIHGLRGAVPGVLYHHEHFDGSGYPLGLKGDEIPLAARIIAVADVFQALVSNRPYRKAYPKNKAIEIIKEESGTHFDPKIVKIFLKIIKEINGKR